MKKRALKFRVSEHTIQLGEQVVEVYSNGQMVATITGSEFGTNLRIITKHDVRSTNVIVKDSISMMEVEISLKPQ